MMDIDPGMMGIDGGMMDIDDPGGHERRER
jgi:hypothetical protein